MGNITYSMQDKQNAILGFDASHFDVITDWNEVKASGVQFAYFKATEGLTFDDPAFASFVKGAKSVGIKAGAYAFVHPDDDPVAEAQHYLAVTKPYNLELKPVIDLEVPPKSGKVDYAGWVRKYIQTLQLPSILYTGLWFLDQEGISGLSDLPLWVSYYKTTPPPDDKGWTQWTMWQYTDQGKINGIQGQVDLDVAVSINDLLVNVPKPMITAGTEGWERDAVKRAIQALAQDGRIQNPEVWLAKYDNNEDLAPLAVILLSHIKI